MPLPKLETRLRTLSTVLPSTKKKVAYRQMMVSEEKILLTAKESAGDDKIEALAAVRQVVANCVLSDDFDADKAPIFDLEWMYLQIYKDSISPTADVAYIDHADQKRYPFQIDLTQVKVIEDENVEKSVEVVDGVVLELRWPNAEALMDPALKEADEETAAILLAPKAIHRVYDGDAVINWDDQPEEERRAFFDSLPTPVYQKIVIFLSKMPRLNYKIEYTNANGEEREIVLSSLTDFFQF